MQEREHVATTPDGWEISLRQAWDEERLDRRREPVLIVPGYGMNSFIFGYHPTGISFVEALTQMGFEVWRADLRRQGRSVYRGTGTPRTRLEDLAGIDVGVAIDRAIAESQTGQSRVSLIGASLGGTLMFLHAGLNPQHKIARMVSMGSPVRWVKVHPLLKIAFSSPWLAGMVRVRHTRTIAKNALPHLLKHAPSLLSIYMNAEHLDPAVVGELVKTVDDPDPVINRQIAEWIARKDLVLETPVALNLSEVVKRLELPLLTIVAGGDGIVPGETASFAHHEARRSKKRDLLVVGTPNRPLAHADMFISGEAHDAVFRPIGAWLSST